MRITSCLTIAVLGLVLGQSKLVPPAFSKEQPPIDTAKIEAATGLKGTFNKDENVFKVSKPRTDIKIRVDELADAAVHGADVMGGIHACS